MTTHLLARGSAGFVLIVLPLAVARTSGKSPAVRSVRVPVTRDTWVSSCKGERDKNLGGAPRLKLKSYQEFSLIDIDPAPLRGRVIVGAVLHLRSVSKDRALRVTASSLASDWVEGDAPTYRRVRGAATFLMAEQDVRPWAWQGSDITAVMNGLGGTFWAFADATPPDAAGRQHVPVHPKVVAARAAGLSYGFVLFDDVGSEYERRGEKFIYHMYPNRFFASRDAGGGSAPYMTVYLGDRDERSPGAVTDVRSTAVGLPPGEALVFWRTPEDAGPAGTLGFFVRWTADGPFDWKRAGEVPRYLIPPAGEPGAQVMMHLRDPAVAPGAQIRVGIRAVDAAGNVGPLVVVPVRTAPEPALPRITPLEQPEEPRLREPGNALPEVNGVRLFVLDPLDKIDVRTGETIPHYPSEYRFRNHLWSAATRTVRLFSARNEHCAFLLVLTGRAADVRVSVRFQNPHVSARLWLGYPVDAGKALLPDPLVPAPSAFALPLHLRNRPEAPLRFVPLLVDVYVDHDAPAGDVRGELRVRSGRQEEVLDVRLRVWNFTLPDYLSFIPEMNCYGLPPPPQEVAWYRLAHRNRTCLNRLPYGWTGRVARGCAPAWDGTRFDWTAWDRRLGPLLDGSAFADLPRSGVPVDTFYLPLNENWPLDIERGFRGGYWADKALTPEYRRGFVRAARLIADHIRRRGWNDTLFEFYLNGKVYYKRKGWDRCSSPWIFDEPMHTQDFWALRWFGAAFHEGVAPVRGNAKVVFRCDISRPQWQRDLLDGLLDVNVVGGAFRRYTRLVLDRKQRFGQVVITYGTANAVDRPNAEAPAWCLDSWLRGADGVLPWQTIGRPESWRRADTLALLYPPGPPEAGDGPKPSLRLKAFRRGQQDVEYLVLFARTAGLPRWAVARVVQQVLSLQGRFRQRFAEDAGGVQFSGVTPAALHRLRCAIGTWLDARKPPPSRRLVDLRTPPRDVRRLRKQWYVRPTVTSESP